MIDDPRVRADAIRTSHTVRAGLGARRPRRGLWNQLTAGNWRGRRGHTDGGHRRACTSSRDRMVTSTPTGHTVALRDMGLSIVIAVAGFRLLTVPGPHPFSAAAALVAGAVLALQGVLGAHGDAALGPIEATCGVLAVTAALTAWLSPAPPEGTRPARTRTPHPSPGGSSTMRVPRLLTLGAVVALGLARARRRRRGHGAGR